MMKLKTIVTSIVMVNDLHKEHELILEMQFTLFVKTTFIYSKLFIFC